MARENWKLAEDYDPKGRKRFQVKFEHEAFTAPVKVVLLHPTVPEHMADKIIEMLEDSEVDAELSRQGEDAARHQRRYGRR